MWDSGATRDSLIDLQSYEILQGNVQAIHGQCYEKGKMQICYSTVAQYQSFPVNKYS
jgi:hypothetical protein